MKKIRLGSRLLLVGAVVAGTSLLLNASAQAAPAVAITCGATIKQNAYLPADLTCPSGNGITVAASATIDLRGHVLTGSTNGVGIIVQFPASVTVTHGRLVGWSKGLTEDSTRLGENNSLTTVTAVTFLHNGTGIDPGVPDETNRFGASWVVRRSWFVANTTGIGGPAGAEDVNEVNVDASSFSQNQFGVNFAATNILADTFTVTNTKFTRNGVGARCDSVLCFFHGNGFSDNRTGFSDDGTFSQFDFSGNTVTGSQIGVLVNGAEFSTVSSNVLTGNNTAVSLVGASGTLADNTIVGNGAAVVASAGTQAVPQADLYVTGNRVANNNGDGLVVRGNAAVGSNLSVFNGGRGIDLSGDGSRDLGGNHAYGNGKSPQCIGVTC